MACALCSLAQDARFFFEPLPRDPAFHARKQKHAVMTELPTAHSEAPTATQTVPPPSDDASPTDASSAADEIVSPKSLDAPPAADDASPQATRFKQIVVVSLMLILALAAVVVVVLNPPSGTQPVSLADASQFALGRKVQVLAPGDRSNATPFRYTPYTPEMGIARYKLFVQENNRYGDGKTVRTELRADMLIRHGAPDVDRSVYVSLDDGSVDIRVYDAETLREIPDVESMFRGIILEGRLDSVAGLSRLIPLVDINPQTGRVLYILSDILRHAWIALPEQPVGVGGGWRVLDDTNSEHAEKVNIIAAVKADHIALGLEHRSQNIPDGEGNAQLYFVRADGSQGWPEGGIVSEFRGQLRSKLDHGAEGVGEHEMAFSLRFAGWDKRASEQKERVP